jgi:hypothetical protein
MTRKRTFSGRHQIDYSKIEEIPIHEKQAEPTPVQWMMHVIYKHWKTIREAKQVGFTVPILSLRERIKKLQADLEEK